MAGIAYLVPYEIRAKAGDLASGRPISNLFYLKSGTQLTSPPAYGAPIAGGGSTTTLLTNFRTLFVAEILDLLPDKYVGTGLEMRKIIGWRYPSVKWAITAIGVGNPTVIASGLASQLVNGDLVSVTGVNGATAANGIWTVSAVGTGAFAISSNTTSQIWSGGGTVQKATGAPSWEYTDLETLSFTSAGAIATEAVALFATASVRRIGSASGRSFQGRNSYSPIPEASVASGGFTGAAKTAWAAALAAFNVNIANGGSETPGSGNSVFINVSKTVAFSQVSPFNNSVNWAAVVTNMLLQPDMGSMLRRKPKLTSVITP